MAYLGNAPADQAIQIGSDTILSSHIDDGVIVNADINASAAIATSKVSGALTSVGSHGLATSATTDTTSASNISSGTLNKARLPADSDTITSVGTLTSLTSSGSITQSNGNHILSKDGNQYILKQTGGDLRLKHEESGSGNIVFELADGGKTHTMANDGSTTFAGNVISGGYGSFERDSSYGNVLYLNNTQSGHANSWAFITGGSSNGTGTFTIKNETDSVNALQFDTSSNATFAGQLRVGGAGSGSSENLLVTSATSSDHTRVHIEKTANAGSAGVSLNSYTPSASWTIYQDDNSDGDLIFYDDSDSVLTLATDNSATFAGKISMNATHASTRSSGLHLESTAGHNWYLHPDSNGNFAINYNSGSAETLFDANGDVTFNKYVSVGSTTKEGQLYVGGTIAHGDAGYDDQVTTGFTTYTEGGSGHIRIVSQANGSTSGSSTCKITWAKPGWAAFSYMWQISAASQAYCRIGGGYHNNSGATISGHDANQLYGTGEYAYTTEGSGQTLTFVLTFTAGTHQCSTFSLSCGGGSTPRAEDFTVAWVTS